MLPDIQSCIFILLNILNDLKKYHHVHITEAVWPIGYIPNPGQFCLFSFILTDYLIIGRYEMRRVI